MLMNKYPNALARVMGGNLYLCIDGIVSFYDVEGGYYLLPFPCRIISIAVSLASLFSKLLI